MENRNSYLIQKRHEAIEAITPICKAFGIKEYDYVVDIDTGKEQLKLNNTLIGCSCNSISAIIDELIGYIFICRWCRNRSLGAFGIQSKNVIKQYWVK